MLRLSLLSLLLLTSCTSTYLMKGAGGTSCATVLDKLAKEPGARGWYVSWLQGYVTRYNYQYNTKLGEGVEGETLLKVATNHCEANPLDEFPLAAESVISELRKRQ